MDTLTTANDYMIYFSIGTTLSGIALLIMLIAGIILVNKVKKPATYLILIGAILKLIISVLSILLPILAKDPESLLSIQGIISILTGVSLSIFALGFIMYASQLTKQKLQS